MQVTKKLCHDCKAVKPIGEFYERRDRKALTSVCKTCLSLRSKIWYRKNPDKVRAWRERYKVEKRNALDDHWYRSAYGISLEEYHAIYEAQRGVCAICGKKETDIHNVTRRVKRLAVDHDKIGKTVRGLLCAKCNRGIGMLNHDVEILRAAISYLERQR